MIVFLVTVYVMVAVPSDFAVTVPLLTVATDSSDDFHSVVYLYSVSPSVLSLKEVPERVAVAPVFNERVDLSSVTLIVSKSIRAAAFDTLEGSGIVLLSTGR